MPANIKLSSPKDITHDSATFYAYIIDEGGLTWECCIQYRRSGKPYWQGTPHEFNVSAPTFFVRTITTKQPTYQHECRLICWSRYLVPPQTITTDPLRFWFIPYSPRSKGAPFLVTDWQISSFDLDITLRITTDIPCHLQVHISIIAPYSTVKVETKRGRKTKHHPVLVWQWPWHTWQTESGDTLEHTFSWTAPMYNTWYHLQALGTTDGKTSPSRSPFYKVYVEAIAPVPICLTDYYDTYGTVNTVRCYQYSSPFIPCQAFIPTHLTVELARKGTIPVLLGNYVQLWTANPDGSPNTPLSPPALVFVTSYLSTSWTPFRVRLQCPLLTPGKLYTITYGSSEPYSYPVPRISWRAGTNLTCPHNIPDSNKRWTQNCTNARLPCDCTGKPWYDFVRGDLYVILEGVIQ